MCIKQLLPVLLFAVCSIIATLNVVQSAAAAGVATTTTTTTATTRGSSRAGGGGSGEGGGIASPPSQPAGRCQSLLDAFCNNATLNAACLSSMKQGNFQTPLYARNDGAFHSSQHAWRCYSPSSLSPDLAHYTSGHAYCTESELDTLIWECTGHVTAPVLVFGKGTPTPAGALSYVNEPSLLYVPPSQQNETNDSSSSSSSSCCCCGVLLAVAGGASALQPTLGRALVLRRSFDGGATWSAVTLPMGPFADARTVGSFFQNQLTYDTVTGTVILTVGNITNHLNSCGNGPGNTESLDGLLQLVSKDVGATWSRATPVNAARSPTTCLAPTTGHGVVMNAETTPVRFRGRVLMAAVHNAYHGDVIVFSDDHGKSYNSSGTSLHHQGLDEVSISQLPNGSLAAIIRNCMPGTPNCQMMQQQQQQQQQQQLGGGGGGRHFLWTTSQDGGVSWSAPRPHQDLPTPVCQGSLTRHGDTLLFAGPYSTVSRTNLTVLASDDNGASFPRSLRLWPGGAGYTGLQCGMLGDGKGSGGNCGVLFDRGDGLYFVAFNSSNIQ